jgi:thioredoxin 1
MANKILRFTASWCGPCKAMAMVLENIRDEINIPVEVVDIDVFPEVATSYLVRGVPTLILVNELGEAIKTLVGVKTEPVLREWING